MQSALAGEEETAGERPGAAVCFPDAKPLYGVSCLSSNLLERNTLAGNDQEPGAIYDQLPIASDIVTLQIADSDPGMLR